MNEGAVFLCDVLPEKNEGIYKKVRAQTAEISRKYYTCHFLAKQGERTYHAVFMNGEELSFSYENKQIYDYVGQLLQKQSIAFAYVRHMLPTRKHIALIGKMKKQGIVITYEIPTYPYFGEQLRSSPNKLRTFIRVCLDLVTWPVIYKNVQKLVVMRSSTKVHIFKKMHLATNGISPQDVVSNVHDKQENRVDIAIVGTLYRYHGVDRLIAGLRAYQKKQGAMPVYFHVVGHSDEIDRLEIQCQQMKLSNVVFHGSMNTEELHDFFNKIDFGIGCLALHRRNADIDTTLKVIEYICRGLPFVTSGQLPYKDPALEKIYIEVENNDSPIDIGAIITKYQYITVNDKQNARNLGLSIFEWRRIIEKIIES